ncbi:MAG: flagellar hook-length control protein FliK, partial [Brevundimonas sp.]
AMLNTPLPGNGAGVSIPGQSDGQADGAFAGLLAMMATEGDAKGAAATASTTVSSGLSLAPFRFNGSASFTPSDEPSQDSVGTEDTGDAATGMEPVVQAGLMPPTPTLTPPTPAPTLRTDASSSAIEPSPALEPGSPEASPAADPATAPVLSPEGEPLVADHPSPPPVAVAAPAPAPAPGASESGAGLQVPAPQRQSVQPNQTAQAPQVITPPRPDSIPPSGTVDAAVDAAPDAALETAGVTPPSDVRAAVETARVAGRQAATTAQPPEAGRLVQPPQPDPAPADRRGERRDGEGRSSLFAAAEAGEPARASVAAPAQTNGAIAATPPPRPGTAPVEARAEAPVMPVAPATPDGEGAPEPVRTTESQSTAALREHLPSTLSRAGVETTAMLSAQIVRRLEARSTRFDMVLTPEHLGRVDVRMEVDSDGQLTARLAFDNPAAAAELRGRADELRRQLEASGFQMSDNSLEFAERDGGRRDQPFDQRGRAFAGAGRLADTADTISAPPRWTALSLTPEGVDMKV